MIVNKFACKILIYQQRSYWHCDWVSELQLDVYHPLMFRSYTRKYDMEEPPKLEENLEESESRYKHHKSFKDTDLEERYYRYGVKPEWLLVHRVINHRTMRDGRTLYLVKWRELPYDQATWEEENEDIPGLKQAIEYYMDLRAACCNDKKMKKSKGRKSKTRELMDDDDRTTPYVFWLMGTLIL